MTVDKQRDAERLLAAVEQHAVLLHRLLDRTGISHVPEVNPLHTQEASCLLTHPLPALPVRA